MRTHAWCDARVRARLPTVRVHDLRHTFARRLRAAGVSFEDRQDLPGHRSGRITTHYSMAELANLIAAANAVCGEKSRTGHPQEENSPSRCWLTRLDRYRFFGARSESRTRTPLRAVDFESTASTDSAIRACVVGPGQTLSGASRHRTFTIARNSSRINVQNRVTSRHC
jgi:hypothetical protein